MLLIIVHELGHIVMSLLFKWKIDKIIILPFRGLTKYNEIINRPLIEEFLVAISGILIQLIFYKFIHDYIDYKYFDFINYFIIIFNLLPIYPLDGSKILNVLFNAITTFKNSILLTVTVSYITIIMLSLLFFNTNKLLFMIFGFLFIEVNKYYKEKDLFFNRFLLERYLNEFKFKKEKTINNVSKMKKDYRHLFYIDNKYITESTFLKKMFDINRIL
jgi:stage IV sporulation protein FB